MNASPRQVASPCAGADGEHPASLATPPGSGVLGLSQQEPGASWKQPTGSSASRHQRPAWVEAVRHFSPSWFVVVMGTGAVSLLLNRLPYNSAWLFYLSIIVFVSNTVLFSLGLIISAVRYTIWPHIWSVMLHDPLHSLFLGAVPIGFSTIINMFVYVCVPAWGSWAITFVWILWMIDTVVAAMVTFLVPYMIITRSERHQLESVNAVQMMPLASMIASSISGSLIANILPNIRHSLWTLVASYALWGTGSLLSFTVLVIYYQRLTLHNLPPSAMFVSVFLPVSPISLGSFAIMSLGSSAAEILPNTDFLGVDIAGQVLYVVGAILSLASWGFSVAWLAYAVGFMFYQQSFPFNLGWWSFTFPIGILSLSTIALGTEFDAEFFKILGTTLAIIAIVLWLVVTTGTIRALIRGDIQYNSCVKLYEQKKQSNPERSCSRV